MPYLILIMWSKETFAPSCTYFVASYYYPGNFGLGIILEDIKYQNSLSI